MTELAGVAVGHLYFFLMFKYPQDFNGVQLLKTPEIL
jgi:derlin-1